MIGDVELHHAAPEFGEPRRLRAHDHAGFGRRRAGGRRSLAALDLDQTEPAGAESLEAVGRAEAGDLGASTSAAAAITDVPAGDADLAPVDRQRHRRCAGADRRARVEFLQQRHRKPPIRPRRLAASAGEILAEIVERAQHRQRRQAAERAERPVGQHLAKIAQELDVLSGGRGRRRSCRPSRRRASSRCGTACICRSSPRRRRRRRSAPGAPCRPCRRRRRCRHGRACPWRRASPRSRAAYRAGFAENRRRAGRRSARRERACRCACRRRNPRRDRRIVAPKASSTRPPRLMLPASWKGCEPRERPTPYSA